MKSGYRVWVQTCFKASHHLWSYRGTPEANHSHLWKVEIEAQTLNLNSEGFSLDFVELKNSLEKLSESFEGKDLNQCLTCTPSAENLAKWFFDQLQEEVQNQGGKLTEVKVWEGENGCASYFEMF